MLLYRIHCLVYIFHLCFIAESLIFFFFFSGYPPSKMTLQLMDRKCGGILLKFCHVEQGRVSFFSFDKVELPILP